MIISAKSALSRARYRTWLMENRQIYTGTRTYYHVTWANNLRSVVKKGLLSSKDGPGSHCGPGIYVWDDIKWAEHFAEHLTERAGQATALLKLRARNAHSCAERLHALKLDPHQWIFDVPEEYEHTFVLLMPGDVQSIDLLDVWATEDDFHALLRRWHFPRKLR